ncbi:YrhC family protein [Bacillus andreraoultii]|uniref:YrhC family protein n=1 Tax=Bacillus andreraoultii TaxID=1499685 RepID=UPI00053BA4FA|nr:YrhC family protein [Bacillus andreraoultii]
MNNAEKLLNKLHDFKNYAIVLTAISTFLYIGLILKGSQLTDTKLYLVTCGMVISLLFAFVFFRRALECKKKLNEIEDD